MLKTMMTVLVSTLAATVFHVLAISICQIEMDSLLGGLAASMVGVFIINAITTWRDRWAGVISTATIAAGVGFINLLFTSGQDAYILGMFQKLTLFPLSVELNFGIYAFVVSAFAAFAVLTAPLGQPSELKQ